MILTFTPNPSIDSSLELTGPLSRGGMHRLKATSRVAGGKGINVSLALRLAGHDTLAVFPAGDNDPFLLLLDATSIPQSRVGIPGRVRINTTVTEPDGTTTKLNGPGAQLDSHARSELIRRLRRHATGSSWAVLAGSLPPGVPADWYATLVTELRDAAPALKVACDTSGVALERLVANFPAAAPDLITPNADELGQLTGTDGRELEQLAAAGHFQPVLAAARRFQAAGVPEVLVTLGAAGAVLVNGDDAWVVNGPDINAVSTVGAGDATMAGYLLSRHAGRPLPECLRTAVAFGRAAVCLPGTTMPGPEHIDSHEVTVRKLV